VEGFNVTEVGELDEAGQIENPLANDRIAARNSEVYLVKREAQIPGTERRDTNDVSHYSTEVSDPRI
jgi:hypothetical protein